MSLRNGVVTAILREQNTVVGQKVTIVDGLLEGESDPIPALIVGDEPAPLSYALFDDSFYPSWVCLGSRGGIAAVCREDFLAGDKANITATGSTVYDGQWEAVINGGASLINTSQNIGTLGIEAHGVARLTSGTTAGHYATLRKKTGTTPMFLDEMAWVRARVRPAYSSGATLSLGVAASNSMTGDGFTVVMGSGAFGLNASGAPTAVAAGVVPAADEWFLIDLVAAPSKFAALWVNGDGPWWTTTTLDFTDDIHLGVTLESDGAATKDCYVDYLHMDRVFGFDTPENLGL